MTEIPIKNYNIDMYQELLFFNNVMIFMCFCILIVKYIPRYLTNNEIVIRKLNQYTNWNLFMILGENILRNYYGIRNIFISKFLALNSFQIFIIYHSFVLYDSRVLFDNNNQNTMPLTMIDVGKYNSLLIKTEYFFLNIMIHILPMYAYMDYLILEQPNSNEINMGLYTMLFKFFWALNVFGNFNVVSIYLPSYSGCHIRLFNILIIFDYISGIFFQHYTNNYIKIF